MVALRHDDCGTVVWGLHMLNTWHRCCYSDEPLQALRDCELADAEKLRKVCLFLTAAGCISTVKGASAAVGAGSTSVFFFLPLRLAGAGCSSTVSMTASSVVRDGLPRLALHVHCLGATTVAGSSSSLLLHPAKLALRARSMLKSTKLSNEPILPQIGTARGLASKCSRPHAVQTL